MLQSIFVTYQLVAGLIGTWFIGKWLADGLRRTWRYMNSDSNDWGGNAIVVPFGALILLLSHILIQLLLTIWSGA